jgi:hypothetical protein
MADDALEEGEIAGELNSLPECAAEEVRDLPRTAAVMLHMNVSIKEIFAFLASHREER